MITEFSRIKARNELDVKIQPRAKQDQRKGRVSPAERRDKEKGKGRLRGGHGLVTEPRSGPRGASARLGGAGEQGGTRHDAGGGSATSKLCIHVTVQN